VLAARIFRSAPHKAAGDVKFVFAWNVVC